MPKQRTGWHGHSKTISEIVGCSTTTVSKVLNGRSDEVTRNTALIEKIKRVASELLIRDANRLMTEARNKQILAEELAA